MARSPSSSKKRVAYYVAGSRGVEIRRRLEAIPTKPEMFYLTSPDGAATDAFRSGTLSRTKPGKWPPASYVYDPLDVRPAELEREAIKNEVTDQRHALNLFGNGLVYHSEPFAGGRSRSRVI